MTFGSISSQKDCVLFATDMTRGRIVSPSILEICCLSPNWLQLCQSCHGLCIETSDAWEEGGRVWNKTLPKKSS